MAKSLPRRRAGENLQVGQTCGTVPGVEYTGNYHGVRNPNKAGLSLSSCWRSKQPLQFLCELLHGFGWNNSEFSRNYNATDRHWL